MGDQYVGEIRQFAGNFTPRGWALCNGQLLSVRVYPALFAVIGITYGGDGTNNFAVPNLQGRVAIHQGQGPGLTPRKFATEGGNSIETLTMNQIPQHTHFINSNSIPNQKEPQNAIWANVEKTLLSKPAYSTTKTMDTTMSIQTIQPSGSNQPHNNMQPYLGLNFIISLEGEFPLRP